MMRLMGLILKDSHVWGTLMKYRYILLCEVRNFHNSIAADNFGVASEAATPFLLNVVML